MKSDFVSAMRLKTDEELQDYIEDRWKHEADAVLAAVDELQARGFTITHEDLVQLKRDLGVEGFRPEFKPMFPPPPSPFDQPPPPEWSKLFSKGVIYAFSILFGVLFASCMMAANINRAKNKKGVIPAIAFGVVYTLLQLWLMSEIAYKGSAVFVNIPGAVVLSEFFWKKYIGKNEPYVNRPVWIPLFLGIAILLLLFVLIMNGR